MNNCNFEAERDILSIILNEPNTLLEHMDKLKHNLFFDPFHIKIFNNMFDLALNDNPIEISTISNNKGEQQKLREIKLRNKSSDFFGAFYKILEECLIARNLEKIHKKLGSKLIAENDEELPSKVLNDIRKEVSLIESLKTVSVVRACDIVPSVLEEHLETYDLVKSGKEVSHDNVIVTPYNGLNKLLKKGGFNNCNSIILAAAPSTGKTEMALNIGAMSAINNNKNTFIYSLEMDKESLIERLLTSLAKIDSYKLDLGVLTNQDVERLKMAANQIKNSPLFFDDNLSGDIFDIIASIRKTHQKYGLDFVIIDYLQLINNPAEKSNQNNMVASVSRILKKEAVSLGIPILLLSQLSRAHLREGREPALHDLRDSGAIEQDADIVILLHASSKERKNSEKTKTKCMIAKQRNGALGDIFLINKKPIQVFEEISQVEFEKQGNTKETKVKNNNEDDDLPF
ncbi:hypothetical protein COV24_02210 [candidate division WWE3 bacterium CG10_big_fil_rev_8_21_14_0_10_32_10]|uniref:DNA 5'-3' helicase n=1 Tax=candidate division WWE3 bacterium CG10_big_fil_rev_8_21_14_0_10_32_10 TaxID=1975090 RepID=A0A2H0RAJ1_UNCKA|nr:MAG: hypothetical protein COV24_02210 [candidate division WWE3 bacterium CG10_big_fil_rev_8_21_14_0_10_32_10]